MVKHVHSTVKQTAMPFQVPLLNSVGEAVTQGVVFTLEERTVQHPTVRSALPLIIALPVVGQHIERTVRQILLLL